MTEHIVYDKNLADTMGADKSLLEDLYKELNFLLDYEPKDKGLDREGLVWSLKLCEYSIQKAWGFPLDSSYHKYWYRIKGCLCPVMDNDDRMGVPSRVINSTCPYHGNTLSPRGE